ncbi:hypothetical protein [Lysinibacillus xylanilyticus]|uniref:hypothetical protein n=1 Tax=Lysinibacillus xylanilyticus TaxID=582475 RepID=UPI0038048FD4
MTVPVIITRIIETEENTIIVNKEYSKEDLLCIPRPGDLWEDNGFHDGILTKVAEVVFNYDGGYCTVYLDSLKLTESEFRDKAELIKTSYEANGWNFEN